MTDTFTTQCPHCQTRFRINRTQLDAARGAVRCGSCLQVFNAARHLVERPAPSSEPPAAAPRSTPVANEAPKPPLPGNWDYNELDLGDLDLDTLDLDEELARLESQERQLMARLQGLETPSAPSAPRPAPSRTPPGPQEPTLPSTGSLLVTPSGPGERTEPTLTLKPPAEVDKPKRPTPSTPREASASKPAARPAPATDTRPPQPVLHNGGSGTQPPAKARPLPAPRPAPAAERPAPQPKNAVPAAARAAEAPDERLLGLADEPLRLDWQKPRSAWGRRLGWSLLNLLVLGALAGQYVWFHYDELVRQDDWRPWFERFCPHLGCNLPPRVDIGQIKSSNLVVRNHPEFTGALVVDAIIYNRAAFAQPFPLLELRFADLNGQAVASRRFKPGEYLSGELAGQQEMPPQTPIHISLEILDPGPRAVNYSLSFHSPE